MRINRLSVKNFKCFEEASWEFSPGFNLIVGDNGSGKTAFLNALSLAASSWVTGVQYGINLDLSTGFQGRSFQDDDVRIIERDSFSYEKIYPTEISSSIIHGGENISWTTRKMPPTDIYYKESLNILQIRARQFAEGIKFNQESPLPIIIFYDAYRNNQQPEISEDEIYLQKEDLSRLEGYRNCMEQSLNIKNMLRWIEREDRIAYIEKTPSILYSLVQKAMCQLLEGATEIFYDPRRVEISIRFSDGTAQPFGNLSAGQRNLLAIAGDIAMRMARLNPHLGEIIFEETEGVILIDEIDLHLHPKWQRRVVDDLRRTFPKVQFFITSHSPLIIQNLDPETDKIIDLSGRNPQDYINHSVEDILEWAQGVYMPQKSQRSLDMIAAAEKYYTLLEQAPTHADLPALKEELDRLSEPFEEDAAFIAALRLERRAKGLGD